MSRQARVVVKRSEPEGDRTETLRAANRDGKPLGGKQFVEKLAQLESVRGAWR